MAGERKTPVRTLHDTDIRLIATAGVDGAVCALVEKLCAAGDTRYSVRWNARTVVDLMRRSGSMPVDILLLGRDWLANSLQSVLVELFGVAPATRVLLIGDCPDVTETARGLSTGLRGCVPHGRVESDLSSALDTLANDQVWLSRRMTSALLGRRTRPPDASADDTWRNLPALSSREFAVVHEAMQGRTNKEIARALQISEQTVKIHLQSIYRKLRIHRRMDLFRLHEATLRD